MAPSPRLSITPSEYVQRERKSIVLLTFAFIAVSALVHLVLSAIYPQFPIKSAQPEQTPQTVVIDRWPKPTPVPTLPPTPTPTPPPRVQIRETPQVQRSANPAASAQPIKPPVVDHRGQATGPPVVVIPTGGPGTRTTPVPDTSPQPMQTFAPCRMVRKIEPNYPDWVKNAGIQGVVAVVIAIGSDGRVQSAHVGASSGNAALDQAAVDAARASTYDCPLLSDRPETDLYQVIYTFRLDS